MLIDFSAVQFGNVLMLLVFLTVHDFVQWNGCRKRSMAVESQGGPRGCPRKL